MSNTDQMSNTVSYITPNTNSHHAVHFFSLPLETKSGIILGEFFFYRISRCFVVRYIILESIFKSNNDEKNVLENVTGMKI